MLIFCLRNWPFEQGHYLIILAESSSTVRPVHASGAAWFLTHLHQTKSRYVCKTSDPSLTVSEFRIPPVQLVFVCQPEPPNNEV
jgi:hypothetical protein